MLKLELGQELEFVTDANVEGRLVAKGTRVRVGHVMTELIEPKVTLVLLGRDVAEALTVPKHVVAMHCRPVQHA